MADLSYRDEAGDGRALQTAAPQAPPEGISESDYETIEDAVMETARGRWFLKEYARRMRASETASLHAALERIERIVTLTHAPRADAQAQLQMRAGMEGICERLFDISWYMRERGFTGSICASIDEEARQLASLTKAFDVVPAESESSMMEPPADEAPLVAEVEEGDSSEANVAEEISAMLPVAEIVIEERVANFMASEGLAPAPDTAPAPRQEIRCAAFEHFDAMPVRQRLALCA